MDLLPTHGQWRNLTVFRSSPGGGKTTLFKLLTPESLLALHQARFSDEGLRELFNRLEGLQVVASEGPSLMGVYISCAKSFASLEDLGFSRAEGDRLFFALLNARITLAGLRAALQMKGLRYPEDRHRVHITLPADFPSSAQVPLPCDGDVLFEWARRLETEVSGQIDSFVPAPIKSLGPPSLFALSLLEPAAMTVDGKPVSSSSLLLLDDAHKLAPEQRMALFRGITEYRARVGAWVAERLEALSPAEFGVRGANIGREFEPPIELEKYWRDNPKKFERLIFGIAERRARYARGAEIGGFASLLVDSLDGIDYRNKFLAAAEKIGDQIATATSGSEEYRRWIAAADEYEGNARERALFWRGLQIIIQRKERNSQRTLPLGLPLPESHVEEVNDSSVRAAAEKLLSEEFRLPYYFGASRLATISSANVDQFMGFAGDLFEEMSSASLLRKGPALDPATQDRIIRDGANLRWKEIRMKVPNGPEVETFLFQVGEICRAEWRKGTASYGGAGAPTGIGIQWDDWERLQREHPDDVRRYSGLLGVLTSCLAHNWLEPRERQSQGGKTWMVLYLNRWLCVFFDLPLHYGGWRPRSLDELNKLLRKEVRAMGRRSL